MPLITLQDAELAFGLTPLLDRANLTVQANERIGLIGRNGTGKSSLLKIIAGQMALDDGICAPDDGLRIAMVEQESAPPEAATLRESLALAALGERSAAHRVFASLRPRRKPRHRHRLRRRTQTRDAGTGVGIKARPAAAG
jgi:ATP-binding cassette subfamily F protein uup